MDTLLKPYNPDGQAQVDIRDRIAEEHLSGAVSLGWLVVADVIGDAGDAIENVRVKAAIMPSANLEKARVMIEDLPDSDKKVANKLFADNSISPWLNQRLGIDDKADVVQTLRQKNVEGGYVVGDELLTNFLEWHNNASVKREREFAKEVPAEKTKFAVRMKQAVEDGWVPASALQNMTRLEQTQVYADDGWCTSFRNDYGTAVSSIENPSSEVTISPSALNNPEDILTHEFIHVICGHDYISDAMDAKYFRPRKSLGMGRLFNSDYGEDIGATAIDEAVVEHLADSLLHGKVDSVGPTSKARRKTSNAYVMERNLLDTLCTKGVKPVDIRLFIATLFENQEDRERLGEQSSSSKLQDALNQAFPFADVIDEIKLLRSDSEKQDEDMAVFEYSKKLVQRATKEKSFAKRIVRRIKGA